MLCDNAPDAVGHRENCYICTGINILCYTKVFVLPSGFVKASCISFIFKTGSTMSRQVKLTKPENNNVVQISIAFKLKFSIFYSKLTAFVRTLLKTQSTSGRNISEALWTCVRKMSWTGDWEMNVSQIEYTFFLETSFWHFYLRRSRQV